MNAQDSLLLLLQEWRRQTLAEGAAIRAQNWPAVRECQRAKQELQTLLNGVTSQHLTFHQKTTEPAQQAALKCQMLRCDPKLVTELVALESANRGLLDEQKRTLKAEQEELAGNSRNLRRVRKSYAGPGQSHWQSYS